MMDITEALKTAESRLSAARIESARLDAEVLLAHALGIERHDLIAAREDEIQGDALSRFEGHIGRRALGTPVAYITGTKEFWSIPIEVTPDVLIPRPETETVVEEALRIARDRRRPLLILDLCTGSGCIARALASELADAQIVATDSSEAALAVAAKNLRPVGARARLFRGDLFAALPDTPADGFQLITANPPYVAERDAAGLPRDVRDFEPRGALLAGPDGLDFIGRIIKDASRFLAPGGWLVMEVGAGQAEAAVSMAASHGDYDTVRTASDLAGIERVLIARRSPLSCGPEF